jgi:hypothetical protein
MSPQVAAIIILGLGILAVAVWQLCRPQGDGRDVGLHLIEEVPAETDDDLEALYRLPAKPRDGAE